jgi:hypothetical protein
LSRISIQPQLPIPIWTLIAATHSFKHEQQQNDPINTQQGQSPPNAIDKINAEPGIVAMYLDVQDEFTFSVFFWCSQVLNVL